MVVQQNKIAYVTGSSRGIGRALVELLLDQGYFVVGISRTNEIEHANYRFDALDLSDLALVKKYKFDLRADQVLLVNNAGLIGQIGPLGQLDNEIIQQVMNVNTIAPQILTNNFIASYSDNLGEYQILNISSGAGKSPISSWATYCASKAAIDLFSETLAEEFEWKQKNNWQIHSCAPGIVDTQMQVEIRATNEQDFKNAPKFVDFKDNGDLFSPEHVASKLFEVISSPAKFPKTVISVRDF
jgi:benzil reductase ((S)-benzoin forming)